VAALASMVALGKSCQSTKYGGDSIATCLCLLCAPTGTGLCKLTQMPVHDAVTLHESLSTKCFGSQRRFGLQKPVVGRLVDIAVLFSAIDASTGDVFAGSITTHNDDTFCNIRYQ